MRRLAKRQAQFRMRGPGRAIRSASFFALPASFNPRPSASPNLKGRRDVYSNDEIGDVTDRRLKMLANGYAPLPVVGKMPPLNGWPTIAIDEALVRSWDNPSIWRQGTPMSTGTRTGETVALDVDIRDATMADAIENLVREKYRNGAGRLMRRIGQA